MQANRTSRHSLLRTSQEATANILLARLSSLNDANLRLDWSEIPARWTWHSPGCDKLLHPYPDVHVLLAIGPWPSGAALPLVEEVPHVSAARAVHHHSIPQRTAVDQPVRLSKTNCLLAHSQCRIVHLPVWVVLREELP